MIGTVLGEKYRLETRIGEGGMATVWLARHLTIDRPLAVKFIHVAGESEEVRDRFLREAKAAASVSHRNVVDIIDFGTTDEGEPYMVMEYLEGATLRELLDRLATPPVGDVVRLLARSLSGLAAVHDAGIIHRDIKPANIFLVRDADGVYPKLLDFGVSRVVTVGGESVLPSRESVIVGTPEYMAPEQARGIAAIDRRADVFAMGVVLYEALSGKKPFEAEHVGDLILKIMTQHPMPLGALRPDLGDPLATVVARALAKEPDARFGDAREMRQALLDAAARTALVLAGEKKHIGGRIGDSLFPIAQPEELLDAVGDSYEPGDSKLIPASSVPPAARPSGASTLDAMVIPKAAPVPAELSPVEDRAAADPPVGRSRAAWVVALAAVAALGAATYWYASGPSDPVDGPAGGERRAAEPPADELAPAPAVDEATSPDEQVADERPPPEEAAAEAPPEELADEPATITVTLHGTPRNAIVRVDGEPHGGGPISLERSETEHVIEVRARRRRTWSVIHVATADGSYEVELRRARRNRSRARGGMIFDNPGF